MWLYCPFCKMDTGTRIVTRTAGKYTHTEYRCGICDTALASGDSPTPPEKIEVDARAAADYFSVGGSDY